MYLCLYKRRGIHGAYRGVKKSLQDVEGTKYCLKIDIKKCYASLDHSILKQTIRNKIKDPKVLIILDGIIDSWEQGVPIGNYLSQFFNNLYFSDFDHFVKEVLRVKHYHRYADDMLFFSANKEELHDILNAIIPYVSMLHVELKPNYSIFPVENGVDFVGYVFRHDYVLLRNSIKREIIKLLFRYINHKISKKNTRKSLASYFGWLKYCNSKHFLYKIETTSGLVYKAWIGLKTTFSRCKHCVNCITLDIRHRYTLIFCIYNKHSKILQTCSKNLKENLKRRLLKCKKQGLQTSR